MTLRRILLAGALGASLMGASAPNVHAQDGPNDRALALVGLARVKRDTGDVAAARRYFEEAARIRPLTNAERAEFFWILQNVDADAALNTGRTVLRGTPSDHDVRDRMIGLAIDLHREDVAITLAEEGARVQPATARWPRRVAESYMRQRKPADAVAAYARVIAQPDATEVDHATRAAALEAAGKFTESADAWSDVRPSVRDSRPEWQRSQLRALAKSTGTAATGEELEKWLATHPDDNEMRSHAGNVWMSAGQPGRAVSVIEAGAGAAWLRQAFNIARGAGLRDKAIDIATRLVESPDGDLSDRHALAEMLIEARQYPRALTALTALKPEIRCEPRFLTLTDRVPDVTGTKALIGTLSHPKCKAPAKWLTRGIERAVADSHFDSALALMKLLPASDRAKPEMQALAGNLEMWSGNAQAAVPLLESTLRWDPKNQAAREALVDALRALKRPQDAWAAAAPLRTASSLTPARLVALGELAVDVNEPEAALDLLKRVPASAANNPARGAAIDRAEDMIDRRRSTETRTRFEALVASGRVEDAAEAVKLLDQVEAKNISADILLTLATTFRGAGEHEAARSLARRSLDLDPHSPLAWFMLVDLSAVSGTASLSETLKQLSGTPQVESSLLIDVANRLSGFVKTGGDGVVDMAISWIDSLVIKDAAGVVALDVARARILAIDGRWPDALASLHSALEKDANYGPALRLRAEVLSWSGEHTLALETYNKYLAGHPDDIDAGRQQARVAGWAGQTDLALSLYDALAARFPNSQVVAAERAAKTAFLTARWQSAIQGYIRWIALEPDNGEARYEHAQALRAAGYVADADRALNDLVQTSLHSMAFDTWSRVQLDRKPGMALFVDSRTAAGYGGQKLLERQTEEGAFLATLGATGSTRFDFTAGRATLRGAEASRNGYHGLIRVSSTLSRVLELAARADVWDVWSDARPEVEAAMQLRMRTADRWTVAAGVDRSMMFENLAVVDSRLIATGATGVLRFESESAGFEAGTGWHSLSDGNARWRTFASYNRTINERWRGLRAIVWTEVLSFRENALLYYSPEAQVRLDAGAQYTFDFRVPRFRGDRINAVTGGYLIGTDRDGVIYHHPTVRASFEFARGLSFEARADWIRSSVYNDRTITFGISVGGSGGVRK